MLFLEDERRYFWVANYYSTQGEYHILEYNPLNLEFLNKINLKTKTEESHLYISHDYEWIGFYELDKKSFIWENWITGEIFSSKSEDCALYNSNGSLVIAKGSCCGESEYECLLKKPSWEKFKDKANIKWHYIDNEKGLVWDVSRHKFYIHKLDWEWNEYAVFDYSCSK